MYIVNCNELSSDTTCRLRWMCQRADVCEVPRRLIAMIVVRLHIRLSCCCIDALHHAASTTSATDDVARSAGCRPGRRLTAGRRPGTRDALHLPLRRCPLLVLATETTFFRRSRRRDSCRGSRHDPTCTSTGSRPTERTRPRQQLSPGHHHSRPVANHWREEPLTSLTRKRNLMQTLFANGIRDF